MNKENKKFYGNSLIGIWRVPSTGKRIIPQLSYGKQRMIWSGGGSYNTLGEYEVELVEGIKWVDDGEILMPWLDGEKLVYDEEM
jgi:hypothetical protein